MKNVVGLFSMVLLVITTSTALPSDSAADRNASKPKAKKLTVPVKKTEPAKATHSVQPKMPAPVFYWFGPALDKKNPLNKDKC